ncbi:DUF3179 domain-containing protein [Pelagibius litoralis]|uniref:DUF3179 domain-containing protein n=1 Tax=Pelagibius litoralis TaxID=374515 RepID=A0A967K7S2_9PROT|nr:DUF3179 domain-containing protein [Pelagibius litoralis]NIA70003.1 DUF3179 domain-containing protein [Pelagibius litoralis]
MPLRRPALCANFLVSAGLALAAGLLAVEARAEPDEEMLGRSLALFAAQSDVRQGAVEEIRQSGRKDAIPALIQARRFLGDIPGIEEALAELTGNTENDSWYEWMLWQQAHPEIVPFEGFDTFKAIVFQRIDLNFGLFLQPGVDHEIRLEEIVWGGVIKDGIPALTNPALLEAGAADYLTDEELVFGVKINGDARAYPLRILDWHEMFNDVVGGVPVSLAYCTLCGSGILFETTVEGRDAPFVFGSSGFLYRSNKLMYDQETHSLWNQFTGRPVVGPLTGSGIELKTRPVAITSWSAWRDANPDTKVLSLETGHQRDYRPGAPYGTYFSSPNLMFPALVEEEKLQAKDYVFALRSSGTEKAWPLTRFTGGQVINDEAGILDLVLIGDEATRTVRAYRRDGQTFEQGESPAELRSGETVWKVTEEALVGPDGEQLARLPGHIAYWFAWSGYLGDEGEVAAR